ncbi:sorting nexin-16-like isoform X1 [Notolabrus celidotus]|uniref:sorting nexin-16-like isoform X1 n=1 Tax=Notolabrus celidotus TaxID=1203425 RepID=UPI00148FD735|nr:sorting nexin-16-like isoform X1 [Notolabrus celidotus]XP_034559584.1 sorting nexin-16-like isoform X1 [Notolabrus celidotus]
MAAPFVPVPFLVDQTEACKSLVKRKCGHPPTETSPSVSALRHWMKISTYFWRRPRGDMLDGMSAMLEGEGRVGDCWVERPITPTLLGYETLEERAKFTVYKIYVTTAEGDSWVIFRRYTDFCQLNDKLKELYPSANLALPPKRWFKDNYNEEFLEERLSGLQMFLQSLALHKEVVKSEAVRRFLCLVDPPGPFDSLVESRAFCETLEETNHRLQRELLDNQREVDALKKILKEKENHFSLLVKKAKSLTLSPESLEGGRQLTETIAIHKNTHKEGDITVKGSEEQHNNESEVADDDTRISITEVVEESNHETSSYIYPLCYWY